LAARIDEGSVAAYAARVHGRAAALVGYGVLKTDWVIVTANSVGAALSGSVLAFKIRDMRSGR
jgi:hypothetical protein